MNARYICGVGAGIVCTHGKCGNECVYFREYIKSGKPKRSKRETKIKQINELPNVPEDLRKRRG